MRTIRYVVLAVLLVGMPAIVAAQTPTLVTNTTLTNAITATQTVFVVGSATAFAAGSMLFADAEAMQVVSVSGTTITVRRGQMGTRQVSHAASEPIFVSTATTISAWRLIDPDYGASCIRGTGDAAILPWFNVRTGVIWKCLGGNSGAASTWNGTNTAPIAYNSTQTGAQ